MYFTCVICAELINQTDGEDDNDKHIDVTPCGHIFHYHCLCQWLERSKTCPQCRNKCTLTNLRRIYFNIANLDQNEVNIGTLQQQLEAANLKNKFTDKKLNEVKKENQDLKELRKKSVKIISKLEERVHKFELMINSYQDMIIGLTAECKTLQEQCMENDELKQKLDLMSSVQAILEDNGSDVEKLLKDESNPNTLGIWVTTLKRELKQCENRKTDMRRSLKSMQNNLRKVQEEKSFLQDKIVCLESENFSLMEKIRILEDLKKDESDSFLGDEKSISYKIETNKNEKVTIDLTTRNDNILSTSRNQITPRTAARVRKIQESNSPYFNIKSSGFGLKVLEKFKERHLNENQGLLNNYKEGATGALKKSTSDLEGKYNIFKKPRLEVSAIKMHNPSLVFNGLGCSERKNCGQYEIKKLTLNERLKSGKLKKN